MSRHEQRAAALQELQAQGAEIRASRYRPDAYAIAARLNLSSQSLAERLANTRRLDARLALLVPRQAPEPPPEIPLPGEDAYGEPLPPSDQDMNAAAPPSAADLLGGDKLIRVASKLAAGIDCLNCGAMIGKEDLRRLTRDYGEVAARFGLKFRSAVPVWCLEALRGGQGSPLQLAATAILVWSEVDRYRLSKDIQQNIAALQPIVLQQIDETEQTVEFVRMALTASAS